MLEYASQCLLQLKFTSNSANIAAASIALGACWESTGKHALRGVISQREYNQRNIVKFAYRELGINRCL